MEYVDFDGIEPPEAITCLFCEEIGELTLEIHGNGEIKRIRSCKDCWERMEEWSLWLD